MRLANRSQDGKQAHAAAKRAWRDRNPDKRRAHVTLGNAVRDGKVRKPSTCQRCGSAGVIHGHHADYGRPLEVDWLCARCHTAEHKEEKVGER